MFSFTQARDQGRQGLDFLRRGAGAYADQARGFGDSAVEVARDVASRARETADEYLREGRRQAAIYETELEGLIKTYPIEAVVIAAGIGFVAGWFVFRRRESRRSSHRS